jgi:hypothetical protein
MLSRYPQKNEDGFAVLAKRWRVERAISWSMRARRNVGDYERLISHGEAHITPCRRTSEGSRQNSCHTHPEADAGHPSAPALIP